MTTPVAFGGLGKRENEFQAQDFKYIIYIHMLLLQILTNIILC